MSWIPGLPRSQTFPTERFASFHSDGLHPNIPTTSRPCRTMEKHEVLMATLSYRALSGCTPKAQHSSWSSCLRRQAKNRSSSVSDGRTNGSNPLRPRIVGCFKFCAQKVAGKMGVIGQGDEQFIVLPIKREPERSVFYRDIANNRLTGSKNVA